MTDLSWSLTLVTCYLQIVYMLVLFRQVYNSYKWEKMTLIHNLLGDLPIYFVMKKFGRLK